MTKKRLSAIGAVLFISVFVIFISIYINKDKLQIFSGSYYKNLPAAVWDQTVFDGMNEDFTVDENFSTHLPIVIIDTDGNEPPIYTEKKRVHYEWIFVDIPGVDPYVNGSINIISGNEKNSLKDTPSYSSDMIIKRRGNSSMLYEKAQYLVKLVTDSGEDNKVSILDMGEDNEWILNGSMADKSMIRNYLAYKTAAQFMPFTPDYEICEVLIKSGDTYKYNGVYLLGENISHGKNRVNTHNFKANSSVNSFILRRDRYDENDIMLDTFATRDNIINPFNQRTFLGMVYPGKKIATEDMINYVSEEITTIEKVLYSDDFKEFSTYPRYIDVDSFVDYFLINEFFGSYDSGTYSTYMYRDIGQKLKMGPVWDYDGTMDNYIFEPLEAGVMAFQTKPWFNRLVLDKSFVEKLENRYSQLRKSVLSEKSINDSIDEIVAYIGPAQAREWKRWANIYKTDNKYSLHGYLDDDNDYIFRNSLEFSNEISKIKTTLRLHGNSIQGSLKTLEASCIWQSDWNSRMDIALFIAMLIAAISVFYSRKI